MRYPCFPRARVLLTAADTHYASRISLRSLGLLTWLMWSFTQLHRLLRRYVSGLAGSALSYSTKAFSRFSRTVQSTWPATAAHCYLMKWGWAKPRRPYAPSQTAGLPSSCAPRLSREPGVMNASDGALIWSLPSSVRGQTFDSQSQVS